LPERSLPQSTHLVQQFCPLCQDTCRPSTHSSDVILQSAIMAVADIVEAFGDDVLPHLDVGGVGNPGDSLLYQLLLKGSSNDKRFVIEEAKRALALTAGCIAPMPLLDLLLPYAAHKSPKVSRYP